jgi:hypothetical protein
MGPGNSPYQRFDYQAVRTGASTAGIDSPQKATLPVVWSSHSGGRPNNQVSTQVTSLSFRRLVAQRAMRIFR